MIESKLEELFNSIENSKLYKEYRSIENILNKDEEIIINEQEIKWSTLDSRTLIDGYEYFTDILCEIE